MKIEELGKLVRALRGDMSLREFAKKCNVSHTTIDNIEKGIDFRTGKPTQVKMATMEKIARACNIPTTMLLADFSHGSDPLSFLKSLSQCTEIRDENDVVIYSQVGETGNKPTDQDELTEQEKTLLTVFRETTEEGRMEMIAAIINIKKAIEIKRASSSNSDLA